MNHHRFPVTITGDDIRLRVSGTTYGKFNDASSNMNIYAGVQDKDIVFWGNDGGSNITALTLDMSEAGDAAFNRHVQLPDGGQVQCGPLSGGDLKFYWDTSDGHIVNKTGDLKIMNQANDKDILFKCDDGSGGDTTYFFLDGDAGGTDPVTRFPDNSYLKFGDAQDFSFVHTGTSYIQNFTGDLQIQNNADDKDILFKCDDGSGFRS